MQALPFYWLRQPLLSIERLLAVLAEDNLASLLADERVFEAIKIATPSVADELAKGWPLSAKIEETVRKYIVRMSTRCTPFGLFAGGAVGYVASRTQLDVRKRKLVPQHRLDMHLLMNMAHELALMPSVRGQLRLVTNGSVYRLGNRIRYIERQWSADHWQYFTSEVPADPAILTVLNLAKSGALLSDLVEAVATEATELEARQFVDRLIEDDLLHSELLPSPTGADPLAYLIEKLSAWSPTPPALDDLVAIQQLLSAAKGGKQPTQQVRAILEKRLGLSVGNRPLLQTDTQVDQATAQISQHVIRELQNRLAPLCVLSQFNAINEDLTAFKQRFYARYEEAEVPLLLALDEDAGVGYGSRSSELTASENLISELLPPVSPSSVSTFAGDALHELRLKLYANWALRPEAPVTITDQDLAQLGPCTTTLPDSFYAFGYFLAASSRDLDSGKYRFYLKALSGPSAFSLMGRFCASDAELHHLVSSQLSGQQDRHPDRILAEVVHLSQARSGNVVQRPHLRPYEIPVLASSSLPAEQQLNLDDLVVSVPRGIHIILRSKRLAKEIIPQLTTAHNYQHGLPIYRFLGDLQHQPAPFAVNWHWGALATCRRLPRVQYRTIILQEATWLFTQADLRATACDDENVHQLRAQYQLPRLIALQQGDQELFLDLDSSVCRQLFVSTLRRVAKVQVIEWLRTPSDCPVEGPDGKLTHEVIIPFVNQRTQLAHNSASVMAKSLAGPIPQRNFPPGSEWLYLKVYCGTATARLVLAQLTSVAHHLLVLGQISHWFFIRYSDPNHHLRFRFKLSTRHQYGSVLTTCQEALADYITSGEVHSVLTDTYRRELERYGDQTIEQTERIFWRDSELVIYLLGLNLDESSLVRTALLGIDAYQTSFGLTRQQKQQCCQQLYEALFIQQGSSPSLQQALARRYRKNQSSVLDLIQQERQGEVTPVVQVFVEHCEAIKSDVNEVIHTFSGHEPNPMFEYLGSIGHMFINRLFSAHQSFYELLVYHHLSRGYQSINAKLSRMEPSIVIDSTKSF